MKENIGETYVDESGNKFKLISDITRYRFNFMTEDYRIIFGDFLNEHDTKIRINKNNFKFLGYKID